MWDLFKAEMLRYRGGAIALAFVHLVTLAFMARMVDLAQQPLFVHRVIGSVYVAFGLLFGFYQMGGYRKSSAWLNLLHRPLPHRKVAAGLIGAGGVLLMIVVALPLVVIVLWQEKMTARVVDLRHWLLLLSALQIALCGYLAAACAALGGLRWGLGGLVFLALLLASEATGFGMLAIELLCLAWLAIMVLSVFKPDLSAPPQGIRGTVAIALPLQVGLYLLMLLFFFGIEMVWVAQGSHPNNTATPPVGGHNEVEKMDDRTRMQAALHGSTHVDVAVLREQIALSEPMGLGMQLRGMPQRNELANVEPMEFDDGKHRVRWVFSHDDMRLHGYSLVDGRSTGVIGLGTMHAAFPAPLLPLGPMPGAADGDVGLVGDGTLYQYVNESQQVLPRIRLPQGEMLAGAGQVGESLGIISDKAIYFFDGRRMLEDHAVLEPRLRIRIPGDVGDLRNLELIELVDGYLIDFVFSASAHTASGAVPYQSLLRVDDSGRVEVIAQRTLSYDYSPLYRYQAWWSSPTLYALSSGMTYLFASALPMDAMLPAGIPRGMWLLAGVLSVLAMIAAGWRSRRTALSIPARIGWVAACGLIGLPALMSFWLMYRPREQDVPQGVPLRAGAAAGAA